jgi:hypothetical protein
MTDKEIRDLTEKHWARFMKGRCKNPLCMKKAIHGALIEMNNKTKEKSE